MRNHNAGQMAPSLGMQSLVQKFLLLAKVQMFIPTASVKFLQSFACLVP